MRSRVTNRRRSNVHLPLVADDALARRPFVHLAPSCDQRRRESASSSAGDSNERDQPSKATPHRLAGQTLNAANHPFNEDRGVDARRFQASLEDVRGARPLRLHDRMLLGSCSTPNALRSLCSRSQAVMVADFSRRDGFFPRIICNSINRRKWNSHRAEHRKPASPGATFVADISPTSATRTRGLRATPGSVQA
jgi:hypothetical protein